MSRWRRLNRRGRIEEAAARERAELYAQSLQKAVRILTRANRSLVELQEKIRARQIEMEEVTAKLTKVRSDLAATMADITIEEVGDAKTTDPTSAPIVPDSQPTTQFLERIFDKQGFPRLRLLMETDSFEQISNLLQTVEQLGAQKATQYVSLQTAMRGAPPEQISWLRYSLQRVADQSELFEQLGAALRIILNLKLEVAGLNTAIHRLEDRLEVLREEKGVSVVHSWETAARLGQLFRTAAMPVAGIVLLIVLALGVITYRAEIGRIASSVSETTPKPAAEQAAGSHRKTVRRFSVICHAQGGTMDSGVESPPRATGEGEATGNNGRTPQRTKEGGADSVNIFAGRKRGLIFFFRPSFKENEISFFLKGDFKTVSLTIQRQKKKGKK